MYVMRRINKIEGTQILKLVLLYFPGSKICVIWGPFVNKKLNLIGRNLRKHHQSKTWKWLEVVSAATKKMTNKQLYIFKITDWCKGTLRDFTTIFIINRTSPQCLYWNKVKVKNPENFVPSWAKKFNLEERKIFSF